LIFWSEEEGTLEWFTRKTGAPSLWPRHLQYRVRMTRYQGVEVAIVDPTQRNRWGRKGRVLAKVQTGQWKLDESDDWVALIGEMATIAHDRMELARSKNDARRKDHPYFGTFGYGGKP
jgi:hypothetical protein